MLVKIHRMLFAYIVFAAASCHYKRKSSDKYTSVYLPKNDSILLALKDTALTHLQIFIDSLTIHGQDTNNYKFQVKSRFADDGIHEHMWSIIFKYNNGHFDGLFADSGFDVRNIKAGDKVRINRKDVEDWLIYNKKDNRTTGFYSEKYLKSKLKK